MNLLCVKWFRGGHRVCLVVKVQCGLVDTTGVSHTNGGQASDQVTRPRVGEAGLGRTGHYLHNLWRCEPVMGSRPVR